MQRPGSLRSPWWIWLGLILVSCTHKTAVEPSASTHAFCTAARQVQHENTTAASGQTRDQVRSQTQDQLQRLRSRATPPEREGWTTDQVPMPLAQLRRLSAVLTEDCGLSADIFGRGSKR